MKTRYVNGWRVRWIEGTVPNEHLPKRELDAPLILCAVGVLSVLAGIVAWFMR